MRRDDASRLEEARELERARGAVARHRVAQQVVEFVDVDAWRRRSAAPLVSHALGERRKRRAATQRRFSANLGQSRLISPLRELDTMSKRKRLLLSRPMSCGHSSAGLSPLISA